MKRHIAIAIAILVAAAGVFALRVSSQNHSRSQNTFYSDRYSAASFARITLDMPRATVIELLGTPFITANTSNYPVEALHNEALRHRYGKNNEISVEWAVFSAPKDSRRPHQRVAVYSARRAPCWRLPTPLLTRLNHGRQGPRYSHRTMSATLQRDEVCTLAKTDPGKALDHARKIDEPWFRAQALSWVARFTDRDPVAVARQAESAARECDDDYQKSAVRAWEIAALAERTCTAEARTSLRDALALGKRAEPASSRSEALLLLLQAAFKIGRDEAQRVYDVLKESCPVEEHWRCKCNVRDGGKMMSGESQPRPFFW